MSDLIDRHAAIKAFTYGYDGRRIPETDIDNFPTQISFRDVKKILRHIPKIINQKGPEHFFITGKRGMGKTSFVKDLSVIIKKK